MFTFRFWFRYFKVRFRTRQDLAADMISIMIIPEDEEDTHYWPILQHHKWTRSSDTSIHDSFHVKVCGYEALHPAIRSQRLTDLCHCKLFLNPGLVQPHSYHFYQTRSLYSNTYRINRLDPGALNCNITLLSCFTNFITT